MQTTNRAAGRRRGVRRLVEVALPLELFPADAVCFIPVEFCFPDPAAPQSDQSDSFHRAPASPPIQRRSRGRARIRLPTARPLATCHRGTPASDAPLMAPTPCAAERSRSGRGEQSEARSAGPRGCRLTDRAPRPSPARPACRVAASRVRPDGPSRPLNGDPRGTPWGCATPSSPPVARPGCLSSTARPALMSFLSFRSPVKASGGGFHRRAANAGAQRPRRATRAEDR